MLSNIRQYYIPVQPTVKQSANDVLYHEFLPDTALRDYIYCYWQLRTERPLQEQFNYRVVADGCIDIFFELDNPEENFVMGFCKKFTTFALGNAFNYTGVRFFPTMFPQLFKVSASSISNRAEHLGLVVPQISGFINNSFSPDMTTEEIKAVFDTYFLRWIAAIKFNNDPRLYHSLQIILKNSGLVNIEKDLDTGISTRQLRRLFGYYIGDTAKTFSQVVRFQNILRAKPSTQSLKQNKLFYTNGYYDQAHFIKEFKNLYGVTPAKAFGR